MSKNSLQSQEVLISRDYICTELASGRTIKSIESELGLSKNAVYRACCLDSTLQDSILQARAAAVHGLVDTLQDIARDEPDVQRARLLTDNIKWAASKLMPSTYGDRIDLNVTHTVDISKAMEEGQKRIECKRQAMIDVTPRIVEADIIDDLNEEDKLEFG